MNTPDLPPLPRVTRSMVFKHFGPNAGRDLLRTEWKDGIDLEVATYALQCFAEDYAAAAVLAEREKSEAMRAALVEDSRRIEHLEGLLLRKQFQNSKRPTESVGSDLHMRDGRCSLYVRDLFGNTVEAESGYGKSVREAIDAARAEQEQQP